MMFGMRKAQKSKIPMSYLPNLGSDVNYLNRYVLPALVHMPTCFKFVQLHASPGALIRLSLSSLSRRK